MTKLKFHAIFAAAALALCASAASAADVSVYGVVDVGVRHVTDGTDSLTGLVDGGATESRIGFEATENLGGGLKAFAKIENRFSANDGKAVGPQWNESVVGLKSKFGTVSLGRQTNILRDLNGEPVHGVYQPLSFFTLGERADNVIKFNGAFAGVETAVQYVPGAGNGDTIGATVGYKFREFGAKAGVLTVKNAAGDKAQATTLIGTYENGPLELGVTYAKNKIDAGFDLATVGALGNDSTAFGVKAGYRVSPLLTFKGEYVRGKFDGEKVDFSAVSVNYALSKRTTVYGELDVTKQAGFDAQSGYTVGVRHSF